MVLFFESSMPILYDIIEKMVKEYLQNGNCLPRKFGIPHALRSEKCDNILALLLLVRDASVTGFMSGGMVSDTVSEGFCNYLYRLIDHGYEAAREFLGRFVLPHVTDKHQMPEDVAAEMARIMR